MDSYLESVYGLSNDTKINNHPNLTLILGPKT